MKQNFKSNCDKTQKLMAKLQNSDSDKTQIQIVTKLKLWPNIKSQMATKLKLKLLRNWGTQIVTTKKNKKLKLWQIEWGQNLEFWVAGKLKKSNCDKYKENLKSILKQTTQIVTKLKKSTSKKNSRSQIMIKFKNSTQIVQTQELILCQNSNRDETKNFNSNKTQN